ncbi:putative Co/Zn/Cd cation transporter (cation efflux family) [Scopulibacillus daqui]|uniref:Co/Zn/Cd cation transporter (Cation efflux family) n=1 Tax=Scopulibacillus daqui TaxID=1469162 RepID=A0ABS2Q4M6_9BACL|nr:hypothetical protein [Scopulibacillus daqui]MBM7646785.1 putative Co/Zn/Cd cation transporter (cation efflux family) [Scopulibacillus daqui]
MNKKYYIINSILSVLFIIAFIVSFTIENKHLGFGIVIGAAIILGIASLINIKVNYSKKITKRDN